MSSDWKTYTFGELGPIKTGKTPPSSLGDGFGGTVPFVTPGDMNGQKWIKVTDRNLNENGLIAVRSSLVPARAVAVSCIGSDMGKAALLYRPSVTNQQINSIVVDESRFNAEFVYYDLSVRQQELKAAASGSATPILNKGHFSAFQILVPPRSTQDKIAEILGSLDDKIDLNRQINQTLEAIAQAIFKSWFVDFDPVKAKIAAIEQGEDPLRAAMRTISGKTDAELDQMPREHHDQLAATAALFPEAMEESELGKIPKGWGVNSILDVCDLIGGAQPPAREFIQDNREGYVRLLQIRDFSNDNHITYIPDNKNLRKADEDDVLIGRYGSASGNKEKDSLGRICRGKAGAYNVALMKLSPKKAGIEFCTQIFSSRDFYDYLQGASNKAVQAGFSKNEIKQYKVILPTEDISGVYEGFARSVWILQKERTKESHNLSCLRDTLLPKLLSGELSIADFERTLEDTKNTRSLV